MKAGWFHSAWWPTNWWQEDWWADYGVFGPSDFLLPAIISSNDPRALEIAASKNPNEPKVEKVVRVLTPKVTGGTHI